MTTAGWRGRQRVIGNYLVCWSTAGLSDRSSVRSAGTRPPQMPYWPILQCASENSRHSARTGHAAHTEIAAAASCRADCVPTLTGNHSSGSKVLSAHRACCKTTPEISSSPASPQTSPPGLRNGWFSCGSSPGTRSGLRDWRRLACPGRRMAYRGGIVTRRVDRPGACRHELSADLCHRRETHRGTYAGTTGLSATSRDVLSPPAQGDHVGGIVEAAAAALPSANSLR
jgi:hypothetical protein